MTNDIRHWITLCEAIHPLARPRHYGAWGASHYNSSAIAGEAARTAGIQGYRYYDELSKRIQRLAVGFLRAIAQSPGSTEPLYHGFHNVKHRSFHIGQIIELPLVAASGDIDTSVGYAHSMTEAMVFEFPPGTPMAGYSRWKKADAKDFGYTWNEAIIGGRFRVAGQRDGSRTDWSETEQRWVDTKYPVITLESVAIFDPATGQWSTKRL